MFLIFIYFFLFCVLGIFISLLCGAVVRSCFRLNQNSRFTNVFFNLFTGLTTLVFLISVISTKGVTINLLIPIIAISIIRLTKIKISKPKFNFISLKKLFVELFYFSAILLPFFIQEFYYFIDYSDFHFVVPHLDFNFYANISGSLTEYGVENKDRALNYLFPTLYKGVTPYHYFELWLNGFFSRLFHLSPLKTFMLITYPILKTGVFFGVLTVINLKYEITFKYLVFAFLFLFISGVYFQFYNEFELTKYFIGYTQSGCLSWGRKYLPLYMVSLLFLFYFFKNEYSTAFTILLLIALFSIGSAPGIITISCLCLAYLSFKNKNYFSLLTLAVFSFFFFLFYKIFTIDVTTEYVNNLALYKKILLDPTNILLLKRFLFAFIFPFLRVLLIYAPYFLMILILTYLSNEINKVKILMMLFIGLVLCLFSSFYAAMLNGVLDSGQLLYNNLPLLNVIIIGTFIMLYQEMKFRKILFAFLMLTAICHLIHFNTYIKENTPIAYNGYSDIFKSECVKELEKSDKKEIIGYSMNDKNYSGGGLKAYYNIPCFFLGLNSKGAHFIDINPFRIIQFSKSLPPEDAFYVDNMEINIYKRLIKDKLSIEELQYKFVKAHNIKYIYIQKNSSLSGGFLKKRQVKRIIEDEITGDKLIVFL